MMRFHDKHVKLLNHHNSSNITKFTKPLQQILEPLGALPGRDNIHRGFNFNNLHNCSRAEPEADKWAALRRTESPGFNLEPNCSSTV